VKGESAKITTDSIANKYKTRKTKLKTHLPKNQVSTEILSSVTEKWHESGDEHGKRSCRKNDLGRNPPFVLLQKCLVVQGE
jgi:hypothetical protein